MLSGEGVRADEARASAEALLDGVAGRSESSSAASGTASSPTTAREIKEFFEKLKGEFSPDVIFTHQRHDLHQDHRLICELTWNTFRDHLILEYEVPKYDGDMGAPNLFVPLERRGLPA